jgi:hypothetical protein
VATATEEARAARHTATRLEKAFLGKTKALYAKLIKPGSGLDEVFRGLSKVLDKINEAQGVAAAATLTFGGLAVTFDALGKAPKGCQADVLVNPELAHWKAHQPLFQICRGPRGLGLADRGDPRAQKPRCHADATPGPGARAWTASRLSRVD